MLLIGIVLTLAVGTFAALRIVKMRARGAAPLRSAPHSARADPAAPRALTYPPDASAKLLHVVDGDTAYFTLKGGAWVKGRLAGINTPECHKKQVRIAGGKRRSARCDRDDEYHGLAAYRQLVKLLRRAKLTLGCTRKRDGSCKRGRHGRVLVTIRADGKDVAERLVRAGAAWPYTKYPSPDRARLCRAEAAAKRARAGMWAAGSVPEVLAMMGPRTRKWYAKHAQRCRKATR
jgi:endonuclease YncB( thermonuclease family)